MPDQTLPQRTLKTTFTLVAFFGLVFALRGQASVTFGLALGGALGLFSLWSLTFAIPRLFHSDNPAAKFLLGMLTLSKLPIYGVSLYYAMASPAFHPIAVFIGVALIPTVLVLKVLGAQLVEKAAGPTGDETCRKPLLSE